MQALNGNGHSPVLFRNYEEMSAAEAIWGKVEHARPGELLLGGAIAVIASFVAIAALALAATTYRENDRMADRIDRQALIVAQQDRVIEGQQSAIERLTRMDGEQVALAESMLGNQQRLLTLVKKTQQHR